MRILTTYLRVVSIAETVVETVVETVIETVMVTTDHDRVFLQGVTVNIGIQ